MKTFRPAGILLLTLILTVSRGSGICAQTPDQEVLFSLPYLAWHPVSEEDKGKAGVTLWKSDQSWPGINIYSSYTQPTVFAMDNAGILLHQWTHSSQVISAQIPLPDGRLLGMEHHQSVFMLDRDSILLWNTPGRFHHDLEMTPDGKILALETRRRYVIVEGRRIQIADDFIVLLSREGEELAATSVFDLVHSLITLEDVDHAIQKGLERGTSVRKNLPLEKRLVDLLHTNTLFRLDRDLPGIASEGDLLIAMRNQNLLAIVRPEEGKLLWSWGRGEISWPHQPHMLPDGRILFFDNYGNKGASRVGIVNPENYETAWVYAPADPKSFFSSTNGHAQLLPNGNFLISESTRGRIFELSPSGEAVWEFWNPEMTRKGKDRAGIERMVRLPYDYFEEGFLFSAKKAETENASRDQGNTETA